MKNVIRYLRCDRRIHASGDRHGNVGTSLTRYLPTILTILTQSTSDIRSRRQSRDRSRVGKCTARDWKWGATTWIVGEGLMMLLVCLLVKYIY